LQKLKRKLEIDLKDIQLLIFDVDGVMTDNRMIFLSEHKEAKSFSAADGFAFRVVTQSKLFHLAVISARESEVTIRRCRELGITDICQNWNKLEALNQLMSKYDLATSQVGFVGNDIPDIVGMEKVGLAVCPLDTEKEVLDYSHYQTSRAGGKGCCREVIDFILKAKGHDLVQLYRDGIEHSQTS